MHINILLFVVVPCVFLPVTPSVVQIFLPHSWAYFPELRVSVGFFCTTSFMIFALWGAFTSPCPDNGVGIVVHSVVSSTMVVLFHNLQQLMQKESKPQETLLLATEVSETPDENMIEV